MGSQVRRELCAEAIFLLSNLANVAQNILGLTLVSIHTWTVLIPTCLLTQFEMLCGSLMLPPGQRE